MRHAAIAVAALMTYATVSHAQTTATIVGTVIDTTGAVVPGAAVKVTNELTGLTRELKTEPDGSYIAALLPPGAYMIEAAAAGFKTVVRKGVALSVQEAARVDLTLTVGAISEQVTITGEAPIVDTRQASVGALMETKRMEELPLNGRTPASLLVLIPTVTNVGAAERPTALTLNVNVAGGRANNNNFLLDNTRYNSIQYGQGNPLPPPDFLTEFRVTTNAYDAEKGLASAATVQVITRSGSNDFHGGLFEFHRDNALTARNFFAPSTPFLVQNQFGGTLGGPIRKNKAFFFFGIQETRIREATLSNSAYPATDAEKNGDFSQSRGGIPRDPDTGLPFPDGIIPQERWDPAAVNYLSKMVGPNLADGRYEILRSRAEDGRMIVGRVDYNLTSENQASARYWRSFGESITPGGNIPWGSGLYSMHYQNLNLSDTHTFSPSLINAFSMGWNRKFETGTNVDMPFETPQAAGINLPDPLIKPYPSGVGISGRVSVSPRIAGVPVRLDNTYDFTNALTWIHGRSTWKFGGDYHWIRFGPDVAAFDNGSFTFNGQYSGNAMADFLLGRPSYLQMLREREDHRTWILGLFLQNDIRVNRRLTLNLGVRYHYEEPSWQADHLSATFLPGMQSKKFPNAPPGLVFVGDPGIPRGIYGADKNNITPRIGLAYDLTGDGKTSLRAGYGVYTQSHPNSFAQAGSLNQPFLPIFNLDTVPSFSEPFRGGTLGFGVVPGDPIEMYNPQTGEAVFSLPATGWTVDPNLPNAYVQNYSLSLQRQLPQSIGLEVSYIGNVGRKLSQGFQFNPAIPGPGATLANTEARRRYYPGQIGSMYRVEAGGNSSFNGLAVVLRKRFSNSYLFDLNYSWMRSLDDAMSVSVYNNYQNPDNLKADWALSDWHRSHVFSGSWVWELPGLSGAPAPARFALEGWQLSGLVRLTTGSPFSVLSGRDNSLTAVGRDRPDVIGDPKLPSDRPRDEVIARFFDKDAFRANAAGQFGNAGRNALIGPGTAAVDAGLFRNFRIWEAHQIQFRSEFFNLFNRVNLGTPNASLISPSFGRILSAGSARQIQLALKYSF